MLGANRISISHELLGQISEIEAFKGLWQGLDRHTTGLQFLGDVADYGANFKQVLGPLQERPITPDLIRALHAGQVKQKGLSSYKTVADKIAFIGSDGTAVGSIETADSAQAEVLLPKLCEWVNEALAEDHPMHPLIVMAVFTAVFLQLAPFDKGNQNMARFLLLLMQMKAGYVYAPYASLEPIMVENALEIYEGLAHNQQSLEAGTPDWSVWMGAFMGLMKAQKDELYSRLYEKEVDLRGMSTLSIKVMELFKEHKRLQMKEIIKLTNGRRATIKVRLQELLEGGYLVRHGQGRSTWYSLC